MAKNKGKNTKSTTKSSLATKTNKQADKNQSASTADEKIAYLVFASSAAAILQVRRFAPRFAAAAAAAMPRLWLARRPAPFCRVGGGRLNARSFRACAAAGGSATWRVILAVRSREITRDCRGFLRENFWCFSKRTLGRRHLECACVA